MIKLYLAVAGIFLLSASILFFNSIKQGEELATEVDTSETIYGSISEGPLPCIWEVKEPEKVVSEDRSQAILVTTTNELDVPCETVLSLRAPGFDMSPQKEEQKILLAASSSGSLSWILTPRKTGTFEIALSDVLNTKIFGITVKNMFGLNVFQAKIASIFGGLFGPMLTVPWWFEKFWQRKKKPGGQKENETKEI